MDLASQCVSAGTPTEAPASLAVADQHEVEPNGATDGSSGTALAEHPGSDGNDLESAPHSAEVASESAPSSERPKSPLVLAMLHVKWATFLQRAQQYQKAATHFELANEQIPSARAFFGRGTCLARLRRRTEAVESFQQALRICPDMVGAHVNLAGVLLALRRYEEAVEHCQAALATEPNSREAVMNIANAWRNLGRRDDAVALVWSRILRDQHDANEASNAAACSNGEGAEGIVEKHDTKDQPPMSVPALTPIQCCNWQSTSPQPTPLIIVCVKWGSRYDATYVNNLYAGVRRHLNVCFERFVCFTDDADGLANGVEVRSLPDGLSLWWGKAYLFSEAAGLDGYRVLFLDLDQVIVGDLSAVANYSGPFALLSTDGIACELASGGYNSSVMSWEASAFFRAVHERLSEAALHYVHRFDHWLEMNVAGADLWQRVAPDAIVDYTNHFLDGVCLGAAPAEEEDVNGAFADTADADNGFPARKSANTASSEEVCPREPPRTAAIVTFPRSPKPHEVLDHPVHGDWVRRHWRGVEEEVT